MKPMALLPVALLVFLHLATSAPVPKPDILDLPAGSTLTAKNSDPIPLDNAPPSLVELYKPVASNYLMYLHDPDRPRPTHEEIYDKHGKARPEWKDWKPMSHELKEFLAEIVYDKKGEERPAWQLWSAEMRRYMMRINSVGLKVEGKPTEQPLTSDMLLPGNVYIRAPDMSRTADMIVVLIVLFFLVVVLIFESLDKIKRIDSSLRGYRIYNWIVTFNHSIPFNTDHKKDDPPLVRKYIIQPSIDYTTEKDEPIVIIQEV